ncbi:MAG: hypothetical protein JWM10_2440 [Myxococcaceae bacterium]|nr:hypothetical protein [Myxococcaceae bacterium]
MSNPLPLPLSQQMLAWLVLALGHENSGSRGRRLSRGTLQSARHGKIITRSWQDLVESVTALLGLPPVAPAPWPELLRRWDAAVTTMRAPALEAGDALLPVLRIAVPRIGVRLGAVAALAASATGAPESRWEWLCDPLDPHLPRRVLEGLLTRHRPEWRTWEQRYAGLAGAVDQRTIEKWNAGAVPSPKVIGKIAAAVHRDAEGPLRWARALMLLRGELEALVGAVVVNSWRRAVRQVATSTLATLTDPMAMSRVAEFWNEELARGATPEVLALFAGLAQMAGVESRGDDAAPWLEWVAAARYGARSPTRPETHAVLLLTILQPHARLLSASMGHCDSQVADALALADLGRWLAGEWDLLSMLRRLVRGEPIELLHRGRPRTTGPVPDDVRDAAKVALESTQRFIRERADNTRDREADRTVGLFLLDGNALDYRAELTASRVGLPLAVIDRDLERAMPEADVRATPALACARARRLAEENDVLGAIAMFQSIDASDPVLDRSARRDLARAMIALAHSQLDECYESVREWLELRATFLVGDDAMAIGEVLTALADRVIAVLAALNQLHYSAVFMLVLPGIAEPPIDSFVMSFPFALRCEGVFRAFDRESTMRPDSLTSAAVLASWAEKNPNDGEVAALLALWARFSGSSPAAQASADKLCEHLGTAPLRDQWIARLDRDLPLTTNAGSGRTLGEA